MIMELKRRLIKITNLYLIFVLFGCAYYSMAGSIPPNIRNVSVPLFVNQTPEFELSEKLTNVIIEQISEQNIIKIVSSPDSDSISHNVEGGLSLQIEHDKTKAGTQFIKAKIV